MAPNLSRLAIIGALLAGASAQSNSAEKVWAVAAYINSGERTPFAGNLELALTPEGAQQMARQGTAFRARYIRNGVNLTSYENWETAYIQGLNKDVLDNIDLDIYSRSDWWINAGALAFMQGLYPPAIGVRDSTTGGRDIAQNYVENSTSEYPLDGYQYPRIQALDVTDERSPGLGGTTRCSAWEAEMRVNLTQDSHFRNVYENSFNWYQQLFSTAPLVGTVPMKMANAYFAYELWDYVDYMYQHNETVYNNLKDPNTTLARLAGNAFEMERRRHAFTKSGSIDEPTNILYTIAGRTLADRIAKQLRSNVGWANTQDKLSLIFGSFEPILSFVSIAALDTPRRLSAGPFNEIPKPGAALVFELFGNNPAVPSRQPDPKDLKVRFYYRASSDPSEPFQLMPLFSQTADASNTSFSSFMSWMDHVGRDQYEWCDICSPTPAAWCADSILRNGMKSDKPAIAPAIAGLIGAVVTLVVVGLAGLALFFFRRYRGRRGKNQTDKKDGGAGGFKGTEKKEGDKDVAVAKNGVHHERSGSWELRDGKTVGGPAGTGVFVKDLPAERSPSPFDNEDDDAISVIGATPVKAHEAV